MGVMDEFEEVGLLVRENPGTVVMVINHSGGKDSMRMLGLVREEFPELPTISVMADTGFEHEFPISARAWVRERCRSVRNPVPVEVVRNRKRTYLEMVEQRGKFPSAQFRQCTSDLKRGPIERFIRSLEYGV